MDVVCVWFHVNVVFVWIHMNELCMYVVGVVALTLPIVDLKKIPHLQLTDT